jgi:hypothetical protein
VLQIEVEDALEQSRAADAVKPGLDQLESALAGNCGFGGLVLHLRPLRHRQGPSLTFGASTP